MLATDVEPNRLKMSLNIAREIVSNLKDTRFGLVVFSSDALIVSPITEDKDIIVNYLSDIDQNITSTGGTDYYKLI